MRITTNDIIIDKPAQEVGSSESVCLLEYWQASKPRKAGDHRMLKLIKRAAIAELQMQWSRNGRG